MVRAFSELGLSPEPLAAVGAVGYETPTAIRHATKGAAASRRCLSRRGHGDCVSTIRWVSSSAAPASSLPRSSRWD